MSDPVTKPGHYTQGGIECIDAIRAALSPEEFRGFCKGNAIKYAWREQHKGGDEDLRKAGVYLSWAVKTEHVVDPVAVESDEAVMANGRWFRARCAKPGAVLSECAHGRNVLDSCGDCYTAAERVRAQLAQAKEGHT